jgi:retron-type reverse transcriptase
MESKYLNLTESQRAKRRKQGIGNVLYVRYADDFVVLCNGTKAEAHATKQEIGELLRTLGLTLSEEKTKVTHTTALSRELIGPIANSAVGCAPWHKHLFSDTNESTIFP